jgi:O-antigen/teichoic acid export membrane protein
MAGSAGGQVLALAAVPLLSRLYSPDDFGVFTVISALVASIGTVAAFRFELAVPLPERERDAHALVTLGLAAAFITAVLGTAAVAVMGDAVAAIFDQPKLRPWLWLVPPTAAAMGIAHLLNQLAIRQRHYGSIGRRNFFQSLTILLTQLAAGAAGLRSGGMALGLGVGQVAGALSLLPSARLGGAEARASRNRRGLWEIALRYRRFPLLLAPSGLLNVLGHQLPILLIAYWYGGAVAGWLGLTQRVLAMPIALVGAAVAQVYLAELSRAARANSGRARSIFLGASKKLALIAAPGLLVVVVIAPAVFSVLFGEEWESSGVYAQAMAVYMATQFVVSPPSQTLVVLGRQGLQLAWDTSRILLVTGAVSATALGGASAVTAIWWFAVSTAVAYGGLWLMSLRVVSQQAARVDDLEPLQSMLKS